MNYLRQYFRQFFNPDGAEGGEYVSMVDPKTQQPVQVPKTLEAFIGHVASINRKDERRKMEDEKTELSEQFGELKKENEDLRAKLKSGDSTKQIETIKGEYEKTLKDQMSVIEKTKGEVDAWRVRYEQSSIDNDLNDALSGFVLNNSQQTKATLKLLGNARYVEKRDLATGQGTGQFNTVLTIPVIDKDGKIIQEDLTAADAVKKFFAQKDNAFHLKNTLAPGGGTAPGGNVGGQGKSGISEEEFNRLNPKDRAAFMDGGGTIK
jgi:hypothetical protein